MLAAALALLVGGSGCHGTGEDGRNGDGGASPASAPDAGTQADAGAFVGGDVPSVLVRGAEIAGANGLSFAPDGRLFVASVGSGLWVIDPVTGETLEHFDRTQGALSPDDVIVAADGTAYFTNTVQGSVHRLEPDGTIEEVAAPGQGANAIALRDPDTLYVAQDFSGDGLWEIDLSGGAMPREVIEAPGWINGMDFGPDGLLYGPRWRDGSLVRIDPESGDISEVSRDFESVPAAVKFAADGELYAIEHVPARVVRVDVETGDSSPIASYPRAGDNLAFDANDQLYISSAEDGSIHEVLRDGQLREVKAGGLAGPSGIAVSSAAAREVVTIVGTQVLLVVDGETGEEIEHHSLGFEYGTFHAPGAGASLDLDGSRIIIADWTGQVEVWDLSAGQVVDTFAVPFVFDVVRFGKGLVASQLFTGRVLAVTEEGSEPLADGLKGPTGLAAIGEDLYVALYEAGEVARIIEGGEPLPTPVSIAKGLGGPEGLAATPDGQLVVVETSSGDVLKIDPTSGEQRVLARALSPAFSLDTELAATWGINGIAVGPSGAIYVTSPVDGNVYRIAPAADW